MMRSTILVLLGIVLNVVIANFHSIVSFEYMLINEKDVDVYTFTAIVTKLRCAMLCSGSTFCVRFVYHPPTSTCLSKLSPDLSGNISSTHDKQGWLTYKKGFQQVTTEEEKVHTNILRSSTVWPLKPSRITMSKSTRLEDRSLPDSTPSLCLRGVKYMGICVVLIRRQKYWKRAKNACRDNKGWLTEVASQAKQEFLEQHLKDLNRKDCVWLGATNSDKIGQYEWRWSQSHRSLSFKNWGKGEPKHAIGCASFRKKHKFRWKSQRCLMKECLYICEYSLKSMIRDVKLVDCGLYGGKSFQESCYTIFFEQVQWKTAMENCKKRKMHLVDISNKEENDFLELYLLKLMKKKKVSSISVWIGLTFHRGNWIWKHNHKKMTFSQLTDGQPEDRCVEIRVHSVLTWKKRPCSGKLYYMCESRVSSFISPKDLIDALLPL